MEQYMGIIWKYQVHMEQYIGIIWKYQEYGTVYGDNLEISGTYMEQYMGIIWKYQEHIWNGIWG